MAARFKVWFPEMELVLVRRATARLPRNTFVFRTDPKWTKLEIREYLQKVYRVKVNRVATINYLGKVRRYGNKRLYKLKDYKKVFVNVSDEPLPPLTPPPYNPVAPARAAAEASER